jgi:uncharacterized protein YgiB involved in biofilm formation
MTLQEVHMGKVSFFVGFGAGYVLGAKAGQERYEQLRRLYDNLVSSRGFQEATGKAKDAVGTGLEQAKEKASEGVSKVTEAVKERRASGDRPSSLSVAPPPT